MIAPGRVIRLRVLENVGTRVDADDLVGLVKSLSEGREPSTPPRPKRVRPGVMFPRAILNALLRGVRSPSD